MKLFFLTILAVLNFSMFAQTTDKQKFEDSVMALINKSTDEKEISKYYLQIVKQYRALNANKEFEYMNKVVFYAEQTRDKVFIVDQYLDVITQLNSVRNQNSRYDKAAQFIDKALEIAKDAQLNGKVSQLYTRRASLYRSKLEFATAVKSNEDAINYAELSQADSIKLWAELSYANTLMYKDESLAAFKKFMNALNLAETIDNDKYTIGVYRDIADFYASVEQKEKAKDYYHKVIQLAKKMKSDNDELAAYQSLINFYTRNKEFNTAREYLNLYKKVGTKAKNEFTALNANLYEVDILFSEEDTKVGTYIRQNPKIISDLKERGFEFNANLALGIMHSIEKNKDSAEYYFSKTKGLIEINKNVNNQISFDLLYAGHLERFGNAIAAIPFAEDGLKIAESIGSLSYQKAIREELDSLYIKSGNKIAENTNKLTLFKIKDSLESKRKAKELLNIEIDSENKRIERDAKLKEEKLRKKHNLQYMGITAAIISLFILLAGLGRLRVKPWLIRGLGFFSFILLFEFIILIADNQIHHLTHGEPLPIILIKIVLIAILLPLHHWLEHKAIHYLLKNRNETKEKELTT